MAVCFSAQCMLYRTKVLSFKTLLSHLSKRRHSQIPVKEIQIPVKYGYLAAKLWGSGKQRPILALHGWQDNAGTWDLLIPMIFKTRPILALDFPGHGLSSCYPPGMMYCLWELPQVILHIKEYFKWDKISLLGHSMGAITAMKYACLYADDVDFYISIDGIIFDAYNIDLIEKYPKLMEKAFMAQRLLDKEPPSYTMEEIKERWHKGTNKSVGLENMEFLIKRGVKQSKQDPNKYYFSRDVRLKYVLFNPDCKRFVKSLVKKLKCPSLCIKGRESRFSTGQFAKDIFNIVQESNENFVYKVIPGTHHVHLNNPELVAPLILDFMNKFKICI